MVAKVEIVEKLGERAVLLPALIEEALAANDRLKIRLTMLQEAAAQASEPGRSAPSMERERRSVGLDESRIQRHHFRRAPYRRRVVSRARAQSCWRPESPTISRR